MRGVCQTPKPVNLVRLRRIRKWSRNEGMLRLGSESLSRVSAAGLNLIRRSRTRFRSFWVAGGSKTRQSGSLSRIRLGVAPKQGVASERRRAFWDDLQVHESL